MTMNYPYRVIARIWENIQPLDRGSRYEDPLQAALASAGIGTVTGGGTQLNEFGGIEYADVEASLSDLEGAVDLVTTTLEAAGARRLGTALTERLGARVWEAAMPRDSPRWHRPSTSSLRVI